jgi:RND family efflux transporter MFP subunit
VQTVRLFSLVIASACAAALLLTGCKPQASDPRQLAPLVQIAEVDPLAARGRDFTGVVTARVQSNLGFRVSGKLVERLVDVGDTVKRGQPLMRIDVTDLQLVTSALRSGVEAARVKATQAASDEQRYAGLVAQGAISALAYEQSKTAAQAAAAELKAAEAQAAVAGNSAGYAVLRADADGVIVETNAEPGQVVASGQAVVRLAHNGPREATVYLPETLRPAVGSVAQAKIYGNGQAVSAAKLRQLSAAADAATRTFEARYVLEGAAAQASLGSTVTISVQDTKQPVASQVPLSAITDNGQGPGVWIIESTGAQLPVVRWRPVVIAGIGTETASITSGLAAGERFVAMGAHMLRAGQPVRLSKEVTATPVTGNGNAQ